MKSPSKNLGRIAARPAGFTLVELLVTITIIAILAGAVLGALRATRNTAKIAKTKATIAKLNRIIMKKYNSYISRRIPINTTGLNPTDAAYLRYKALNDLMRMEMPDRSTDIQGNLMQPVPAQLTVGGTTISIDRPALSEIYLTNFTNKQPTLKWLQAECLYMIIATDATALADFSESEIGDTPELPDYPDGDGYPEFLDAWGMPIAFLRWAPKYLPPNTELQSDERLTPSDPYSDFCYPNPFDPLRQDKSSGGAPPPPPGGAPPPPPPGGAPPPPPPGGGPPPPPPGGGGASGAPISYKLVPLIYSMGPDKGGSSSQYGFDPGAFKFDGSPFTTLNGATISINMAGAILGGTITDDNITNHRIEAR